MQGPSAPAHVYRAVGSGRAALGKHPLADRRAEGDPPDGNDGRDWPAAEAGDGVSGIAFSKEIYDAYYAQYAPYGLTLDASGRLMYEGKRVRYFEDMYPVDLDSSAGTAVQFIDGEVDVYAVRDLTGPILRNPDGSFDPSGRLTGLRAATQEEFDARTQSMAENDGHAVTSQSSQAIS